MHLLTFAIDQTRPICLRCQKDGFECDGYETMKIVQVHSQTSTPPHAKAIMAVVNRSPDAVLLQTPMLPRECTLGGLCSVLHCDLFVDHPDSWVGFDAIRQPYGLAGQCLYALSQGYYERKSKHTTLTHGCATLYLDCLRDVNKSLGTPELRGTADTLLAVAILGVYEVGDQSRR